MNESTGGALWRRDEPLCRAAELLDRLDGKIQAVSFDFFDTLVWRLVNRPIDVFTEVGGRLRAQEAVRRGISPADFGTLRRHAEYKTRERLKISDPAREDISLTAIYGNLQAVLPTPAAAAAMEHAAECEVCLLNPGMVEFIHYARQRGLRVLIISDIYFSADQLRTILTANHLDPALFELVLTSCDAGLCKGTGNLFKHALQQLALRPEQLLHLGDNYHADVVGARKAGVHACHYPQAGAEVRTILEREQVLLGGQTSTFNANSLRMLAARYFPEETAEGFFGRMGALLMGPLMTRFASWACEQYVEAGVRKVGAFMREGDLFAQVLQREAQVKGYGLDVQPLFINRRATNLAALGKLSASGLLTWLERRSTLTIRNILKHFGLPAEELRKLPFCLDEKADTREKILKLAEYLFTPRIAGHIETKSAEERLKVMDYLRPWLESGNVLGLCDIGYSASAQSQLHRILELEQNTTKMVGCYLITCEGSATRVLEGLDVRHFLGSFGKPDHYFRSILRSPAFIEQSLVAPLGTTFGYERDATGTVTPLLEPTPFSPETLRKQKVFKEGVLLFQSLWFAARKAKPALLDGQSEFSRRVLAEVDTQSQAILTRAAAFPVTTELTHFGSLALDDYYFGDVMKPMCSPKDRESLRQNGYARLLAEPDVHWPQGVHALENPRSNSEFFSYARTFILGNPERDGDGMQVDLTVFVAAIRNPALLTECLGRLRALSDSALRIELVVGLPSGHTALLAAAREFSRQFTRFKIAEISSRDSVNTFMNGAADESAAPLILFLQEDTFLPAGWDKPLLEPLRASAEVAAVYPTLQGSSGSATSPTARCLAMRRSAFVEGLGFAEKATPDDAVRNLAGHLHELKWKTVHALEITVEVKSPLKKITGPASLPRAEMLRVDWVGSFQDYGSLSQVNRACTQALGTLAGLRVNRGATASPQVTVRHQWPPDWSSPKQGALVIIQPWEFGALPADWVTAARGVNEFWVPSRYVRQVFIDSGIAADKVVVIPNGVNPAGYRPGLTPLPLATKKKFRFLFVGGTIRRKGPDVLLKAYLEAFTAEDDVCLVIKDFGGNSIYQGQTFEKEIEAARLRPNAPEILYLNSELPAEDMPRLYAACHCLVHPYRGEGFGMPVLEAMACGLPVVVTRGGATDDFVGNDAGWFIPSERKSIGRKVGTIPLVSDGWWLEPDGLDLVNKLKYILSHPDEAKTRGAHGAEAARKNYTWQHVAELMQARLRAVASMTRPIVKPTAKVAQIELPPTALVGHLGAAREALHRKRHREAWDLALTALQARPFHPEAWLVLAQAAHGSPQAKQCWQRARQLAPNWKGLQQPAKNQHRPVVVNWPPPPEARSAPRLTVCLITKNEEAFLERCLQSVSDIASQIVVVDTGSTDRTVEIAKKFKAEVHFLAWNDDFSAARNEALQYATGDWVLSLDADEELLPDHRRTLVEEMRSAEVMAYRLPILDVGREQEGCSYVPRLFRNAPGLFFLGRVHEQIFSSAEVRAKEWGLENRLGRATLLHHGYRPDVVVSRDKIARNLRLLRLALEELPGEPNLVMNLGLELIRSGQIDAGLEQYREALQLMAALPPAQVVPELRETLLTQLTNHLLKAKRFREIVQLWEKPFSQSAGMTASQHFMLGLAHMELREPAPAAAQMRQCLATRQTPALSPVNKEILKAGPHHCLAMSLAALEDAPAAEQAFHDALREDPKSRVVRLDFAKFQFQHHRSVEALTQLNEIVAENPAELAAWRLGGQIALSQLEFLEFAQNWTSEAIKNFPEDSAVLAHRAEALTLAQQVELALPLWRKIQAAPSARHLAALILCELLIGEAASRPSPVNEKSVSQEFLKWYRQLIKGNAHSLVHQINDKLDDLRATLPSAADILATALKRADDAVAV